MTSDAKEPQAEAVIEKMLSTIPGLLVGSDIIVGFGERLTLLLKKTCSTTLRR
jgi:tRNA A37 methylthiotransferase MiaB